MSTPSASLFRRVSFSAMAFPVLVGALGCGGGGSGGGRVGYEPGEKGYLDAYAEASVTGYDDGTFNGRDFGFREGFDDGSWGGIYAPDWPTVEVWPLMDTRRAEAMDLLFYRDPNYLDGYVVGYEDGFFDAFDAGFADGYANAYADGFAAATAWE